MTRKVKNRRAMLQPLEPRTMLSATPTLVGDFNLAPTDKADHAWLADEVFFAADDGSGDVELWKSDGKPDGTIRVKDIRPGSSGSLPRDLTAIDGKVLFTAYTEEFGRELWVTDGTEHGTVLVQDFHPGPKSSDLHSFTHEGGYLFFADTDNNVYWKTDGTSAGTHQVESLPQTHVSQDSAVLPHNQHVVFVESEGKLSTSDGTPGGTSPLRYFGFDSEIHSLTLVGNEVYFAVFDFPPSRDEPRSILWRTDGTRIGTKRVHTFDASIISSITPVNDDVYVTIDPDKPRPRSSELWRSDGTRAGTTRITTVDSLIPPREVSGLLYFVKDDAEIGRELWKTDGTDQGTVAAEIAPGIAGSDPWIMAANEETILIWSMAKETRGLWTLSIGESQPMAIKSGIVGPSAGSEFRNLIPVGDQLYFTIDGDAGELAGIWRTDGSSEGTAHVAGVEDGVGSVYSLTEAGGRLYFWDERIDEHGGTWAGLWRLDNNSDKPVFVKESWVGDLVGTPIELNGELYFVEGGDLWKVNPSTDQTEFVIRLPSSGGADSLFAADNQVYIKLGYSDVALWRSDGTTEGTYLLGEFPQFREYLGLTIAGDRAYFDTSGGFWMTDGTVEGTQPANEFSDFVGAAGENLIFRGPGGLWASDGTDEGTRLINEVDFEAGSVSVGETLFLFSWDNDQSGLWASDGTKEGTVQLTAERVRLAGVGSNVVYFNNRKGELWQSDGTVEGTVPAREGAVRVIDSNYRSDDRRFPWRSTAVCTSPVTMVFMGRNSGAFQFRRRPSREMLTGMEQLVLTTSWCCPLTLVSLRMRSLPTATLTARERLTLRTSCSCPPTSVTLRNCPHITS